ncbi:GDSL-type esterase/lipase family protein [Microbacteriaceae bacterium 4G12]
MSCRRPWPGRRPSSRPLRQLGPLGSCSRGVRLVTVTAGGNDLDVVGLAAICAPDPESVACLTALAQRQGAEAALAPSLVTTYAAIAAAAPKATIIVTGYPPLLSTGRVSEVTMALNALIQQAVQAAAAGGARIEYVDVTAAFAGHGLDSSDPWFVAAGPDAFHPIAEGHRAYARAIAAAL